MHFRILKMIAASGFLAAIECTKFVFGQGRAAADLLAALRGKGMGGKGTGVEGTGREREWPP